MRDVASLAAAARQHRGCHRRLCGPTAGHGPAVDQDAAGLPAARADPPLRVRPGRDRLRPGVGARRRQRHQDRLDAGAGHRKRRSAAAPRSGRCRPVRPRPGRIPDPEHLADPPGRRGGGQVSMAIRDAVSQDLRATLRALKLGQMLDTCPTGSPRR